MTDTHNDAVDDFFGEAEIAEQDKLDEEWLR